MEIHTFAEGVFVETHTFSGGVFAEIHTFSEGVFAETHTFSKGVFVGAKINIPGEVCKFSIRKTVVNLGIGRCIIRDGSNL